nr:MAG TPA: hypothetical protein [Caudoviricetes sp.]
MVKSIIAMKTLLCYNCITTVGGEAVRVFGLCRFPERFSAPIRLKSN